MSTTVPSMDPRLPPELEHQIFEIAAHEFPEMIPIFLRVARHIQFWIEPLLYQVILAAGINAASTNAVLAAMDSRPRTVFNALSALPALTHLCLMDMVSGEVLRDILSTCKPLEVLVNMWATRNGAMRRRLEFAFSRPFTDVRFVMAYVKDPVKDWKAGAEGGNDFWAAAENLIAWRRASTVVKRLLLLQRRQELNLYEPQAAGYFGVRGVLSR
ncbi:hypothetical protein B0H13DRAFT_1911031 [Mycena leptocephala]|nr:hypothetical protein B0H13DRAFT_1911031 [Mycena leptocephala]